MTVKWETPPAPKAGRRGGKWPNILRELDSRPGDWAVVAEDVPVSTRGYLERRYGAYEFTNRGVKSGRAATMYGRRKPESE